MNILIVTLLVAVIPSVFVNYTDIQIPRGEYQRHSLIQLAGMEKRLSKQLRGVYPEFSERGSARGLEDRLSAQIHAVESRLDRRLLSAEDKADTLVTELGEVKGAARFIAADRQHEPVEMQ